MQDQTPSLPAASMPVDSDAAALTQLGFGHMIHHLDVVGWIVLITLVVMSLASWFYIIANSFRNSAVRSRADKVIRNFWGSNSTQEAIQYMESQPKNEPFSKIALECAEAAAHHSKHEGGRMVEILNRSEFIDRALRQAVTRESSRLETGLTMLASAGSSAPFIGLLAFVIVFIVQALGHTVMIAMENGRGLDDALEAGFAGLARVGGEAGCIVLTPEGKRQWRHNSSHFAVAYCDEENPEPKVFLRRDEDSA